MPETAKAAGSRGIREILKAARQDSRRKALNRFVPLVCMAAMIVGLLNFVLFMAGATYFGGDAVNGRAGGGRYFLWGPHDGTKGYHEVSRAIFLYSKWHTISMLVTWVLMLVAAFVYERIGKNSQS